MGGISRPDISVLCYDEQGFLINEDHLYGKYVSSESTTFTGQLILGVDVGKQIKKIEVAFNPKK